MMDMNKGTNQKIHDREYSCPHYDAPPGEKRCRNYLDGGSCARPDQLMCVEWLKCNDKPKVLPKPGLTDLFGNPLPKPETPKRIMPKQALPREVSPPEPESTVTHTGAPVIDVDQLPGLKENDIASFKARGIEVCLESEAFGTVWLVPKVSGRDRKEITPEHVATIIRTMAVFPGAQVVSFEKSTQQNCHECKCKPNAGACGGLCPNPCQKCKQRHAAPSQRRAG